MGNQITSRDEPLSDFRFWFDKRKTNESIFVFLFSFQKKKELLENTRNPILQADNIFLSILLNIRNNSKYNVFRMQKLGTPNLSNAGQMFSQLRIIALGKWVSHSSILWFPFYVRIVRTVELLQFSWLLKTINILLEIHVMFWRSTNPYLNGLQIK